jgi:hypothetical protein
MISTATEAAAKSVGHHSSASEDLLKNVSLLQTLDLDKLLSLNGRLQIGIIFLWSKILI